MWLYILQGIAYGLTAAAQPGPFQTYLISQTLVKGWKRSLPAALAPLLSDGPIIALCLLVLSQVPPWLQRFLYIAGGLFVLYLAYDTYKAWKNFDIAIPYIEAETQRSVLKAALINTMNPNPYIFWSLVTGPILLTGWHETPLHGLGFVVAFYITMILGLSTIILVFGFARHLGPKVNRALLGISAIALFCFGLFQLCLGIMNLWRKLSKSMAHLFMLGRERKMNNQRSRFLGLCALISVILVSCMPVQKLESTKIDPSPHIVIMSAFEPELTQLRSQAKIMDVYVINGRTYHVGELAGKQVVLVLSGVSMVNAAMTTQTALDYFHVDEIVVSGIAGGVNPGLKIGDVVVPAQWGEYQEQTFARATADGLDAGQSISEFGNYEMMFPRYLSVTQKDSKPDREEQRFWLPASQDLLEVARDVADKVQLSDCTQIKLCLQHEPNVVVGGNGVSGPTFVDNASYREWVWQTFKADALDMESAAVAHVAYVNNVPFIAFRSLSDLAGGGPGKNEMSTFFQLAADNSAKVVMAFLERLPEPRE